MRYVNHNGRLPFKVCHSGSACKPVAVGAQQPQVLDAVPVAAGNNVIHFEDAERELGATSVAPAFLLADHNVLVLSVGNQRVDVGASGT